MNLEDILKDEDLKRSVERVNRTIEKKGVAFQKASKNSVDDFLKAHSDVIDEAIKLGSNNKPK